MVKAYQKWTVYPHGPIEQLAENLWRVEGTLPNMKLKRVFTIVRLSDGQLLFHSAIALDGESMREIEAWGNPAFLIVPNGWHRLDAPAYVKRFPNIKVHCPEGAQKKVMEVVKVDGTYDTIECGDSVDVRHLKGTGNNEGVVQVRSNDGTTLVFNDIIFNQPHLSGLEGFIMRLIGSTGGSKITRIARLFMVKDRKKLREELTSLAVIPDLCRIIVSHGLMMNDAPSATLREVAGTL